jgi:type VI secretion system secreted protein Hcp
MALVDYFLKIDGIDGESTDAKHKDEIDVLSFSWGETNEGTQGAGGGGGAGKVQMQDFHFVANTSKASPALFLGCASGEHFKKAVLTARKAGKEQLEFMKVTMEDLLISSYQVGGSAGDVVPVDQVSINFAKIEFSYRPQNPDGSLDQEVSAGWDQQRNVKI